MSSISEANTSLKISNFSDALQCPVLFTPLTDAVLLNPCGHTISEVAANNIFHGMQNINGNDIAENQAPCPLCRRKVVAYIPNLIVRSIVENALGIKPEKILPAISATIAADEEINIKNIPFPGKGAKFVLNTGNWELLNSGSELVRELNFLSQTKDSFFDEISVLGYRDGSIAILLSYSKNREIVNKYLEDCGIKTDHLNEVGHYISNKLTTKKLFEIIVMHNEMPADKINLIRDLVISDDWNKVTPLKMGESLPLRRTRHFGYLY